MEPGLPPLEGDFPVSFICGRGDTQGTGVFANNNSGPATYIGVGTYYNATRTNLNFAASLSNPIYGNSNTVNPLSLSCRIFIKY